MAPSARDDSRMGSPLPLSPDVRWDCRQTLKPDWEKVVSEDKTYYWNTITDEVTWREPLINQRVMIKTSPDGSPVRECAPEGRTFLNWRANDPRPAARSAAKEGHVEPKAELEEPLPAAGEVATFGDVKARFHRLERDAMEEDGIYLRANSRRPILQVRCPSQQEWRQLLRASLISLEGMVKNCLQKSPAFRPRPAMDYAVGEEHVFQADVHSTCKSRALTVEALEKYKAARDLAEAPSPEQEKKELLLARCSPDGHLPAVC